MAYWRSFAVFALALPALALPAHAADTIKIGLLKSAGSTAVYLAQDKGYFAAEGLDAQFTFFDAAQPIAVAAVAGGIDIGSVGTSAGMFSLGAQGVLKLIGGQSREHPGFQTLAFLESNKAYASGLKSYAPLGGHSVAVAQIGSGITASPSSLRITTCRSIRFASCRCNRSPTSCRR